MLSIVERCQGCLVCSFKLNVARIADSDLELESHRGNRDSLGRATDAQSSAAMPAVMLSKSQLSLVHHRFDVPEERSSAGLTGVRLHPGRSLFSIRRHVPANDDTVLATGKQDAFVAGVAKRGDFVVMALKFIRGPLPSADVPDNDALIEAAGKEQLLPGVPA